MKKEEGRWKREETARHEVDTSESALDSSGLVG